MLDGAIQGVDAGRLVGWAADHQDLGRQLSVDVNVNGKLVRKAVTGRWSDGAAKATGDGAHGFIVALPTRTLDGGHHHLSVTVAGELTLPDGPSWETYNVSQPDGTSFERMRWGAQAPTLPEPRLLEGRDGWAFLCDDANGNLDQLLGDLRFTEPDLHDFRAILLARQRHLAQLGIPYLFAVIPSKEAIYPERLPASSPQVGIPGLTDQLTAALAGTDVRIVDLHDPMRVAARARAGRGGAGRTSGAPAGEETADGAQDSPRPAGEELYYLRDCHWTFEGALVGAQTLLEALRSIGVTDARLDERGFSREAITVKGDLTGKERVALRDGRLVAATAEMEPVVREPDRKPDLAALGLHRVPTPEHLAVSRTRETVILEHERRRGGPHAMVYRDSFGDYLQPFLSSAFARTTWLWTRTIDLPLIERERPDVVIQVVAERFLAQVPYGDVLAVNGLQRFSWWGRNYGMSEAMRRGVIRGRARIRAAGGR
jgi:alginate O-acetyltransferase complex protein AlgJ